MTALVMVVDVMSIGAVMAYPLSSAYGSSERRSSRVFALAEYISVSRKTPTGWFKFGSMGRMR